MEDKIFLIVTKAFELDLSGYLRENAKLRLAKKLQQIQAYLPEGRIDELIKDFERRKMENEN